MDSAWWAVLGGTLVAGLIIMLWLPVHAAMGKSRFARAQRDFHTQRERLEAKFVRLISTAEQSADDEMLDCYFDDDVAYVRDRSTGQLSAFVAVNVLPDQDSDVDLFGPEIAGNLHAGTAVFRFDQGHWETDGRTIHNLSPTEAISVFHNDFEVVAREKARRCLT